MTVVSIGELLWDIFPNGEHLGGAPFNFAAACVRLGHEALFLTAVGDDELGTRAMQGVAASCVSTEFVQRTTAGGTGVVRVEFDRDGQPDYTIVRPAAYDFLRLDEKLAAKLAAKRPAFIYFGTLSQTKANNREVVRSAIRAVPQALKFYDINLRRNSFSRELLLDLLPEADIVKFNEAETHAVQNLFGEAESTVQEFCGTYAERFQWKAVCVTCGAAGCALLLDGSFVEVPGFPVENAHPVGAGDAFSAALCHGIHQGWSAREIGGFANRVAAQVVSKRKVEDVH